MAAFALSILVHVFLAFFLHPPQPTSREGMEPIRRVQLEQIVRVTPAPRPRPTPRKAPSIVAPHVVAARAPARAPRAQPVAPASPVIAASIVPTRSPAGRCTQADAPAAVASAAEPPEIPADVRAQAVGGVAAVRVQLDASGAVTSASIEESTHSPSFDALAIEMARDTQYSPARHDCKAVASSYLFRVEWAPW